MAIRERVRRALRKSEASDSNSQTDGNTTTTTTTANTSQSSDINSLALQKTTTTSSKLSRTFTFGSRDKSKDGNSPKDKKRSKRKPMHPSEKPLTAQNLRHQEMLSHFTMTFGTDNMSQIELPGSWGISPCCTRSPSIDGDYTDRDLSSTSSDAARSLAELSLRE